MKKPETEEAKESSADNVASNSVTPKILTQREPAIRKEFFDGLCGYLLGSPGRLAALARVLQIYAVKRREFGERSGEKGNGKLRNDGASWKKVHSEMKALRDEICKPSEVEASPKLTAPSSADTLRNFALGVSERTNGGDETYGFLAIFLIEALQQHPDLRKETRLTKEDKELIARFLSQWQWLSTDPQPGVSPLSPLNIGRTGLNEDAAPSTNGDDDTENMRRYIARFFDFPEDQRNILRRYFETVASGRKGYAHFICYRSQLSRPNSLIKSFLAIVPPGEGEHRNGLTRNYTFTHVYQVDHNLSNKRISVGVVLPMAHGLYFVGGQQTAMKGGPAGSHNFLALKVIAVPWEAIEQGRTILPALALSTNNREFHIVSRLAIRPTMLTSDEDAKIGAVDCANLVADLGAMSALESEETSRPLAFQNLETIGVQASEILKASNNIPGLDVTGCFRKNGRTPINGALVVERINSAFQDADDPFTNQNGKSLDWTDLRFGALDTNT